MALQLARDVHDNSTYEFEKGGDKIIPQPSDMYKDLPNVAIATPTYNRKQFWKLMVHNIKKQKYPRSKLTWYIFDDSSNDKGLHSVLNEMRNFKISTFHDDLNLGDIITRY